MSNTHKKIADLSREEKRALLAELLRKKAKESRESRESRDWSPLSHGQRALWFLYRLAPESPAYNLLYAAHVRSPLDIPSLSRTCAIADNTTLPRIRLSSLMLMIPSQC